MTQDEVDSIYDYLHENYIYEYGELIVNNDRNNTYKKGHKLGDLSFRYCGHTQLCTSLFINGKRYNFRLSHLVYIFFNKKKPKWIKHKDSNYLNNKIENLQEITNRGELSSYNRSIKKPQGFMIDKKCNR